MPKIFKPNELDYKLKQPPVAEFSWHASENLSKIVKSKHLNFTVKSLDPGKYSYPYHFHRNSEEIFVIISGKALLRTPDKFEELVEDDIVFFEIGPEGAHQLYNHSSNPCVYLDLGTVEAIDICEYPDSGKINILPYREIFQSNDQVDYFANENKVADKWPRDILEKLIDIKFERASLEDVEQLIDVQNQSFYPDFIKYGECPGYNHSQESMSNIVLNRITYKIIFNGQIVGDIIVRDNGDDTYYLGCLCVVPSFENKGIGQKAMKFLEQEFPNAKKWSLETPADKYRNHYFYRKFGFEVTKEYMSDNVKIVLFEKYIMR